MAEYEAGLPELKRANYTTHSILHHCFPPKPNTCIICGREGLDLHAYPCNFSELEVDLPE